MRRQRVSATMRARGQAFTSRHAERSLPLIPQAPNEHHLSENTHTRDGLLQQGKQVVVAPETKGYEPAEEAHTRLRQCRKVLRQIVIQLREKLRSVLLPEVALLVQSELQCVVERKPKRTDARRASQTMHAPVKVLAAVRLRPLPL